MDDVYANEVAKRAVARACVALGFKYCQESALESLADILKHYILTIGSTARDQAEVSGRSVVGIQDIILAIEIPKPKSTSWKELRAFGADSQSTSSDARWNQPFPFDVPYFPVDSAPRKPEPTLDANASHKSGLIPSHLPPFPPAHTYKRSTTSKKRNAAESGEATLGVPASKKVSGVRSAQQSLAMIEDSLEC